MNKKMPGAMNINGFKNITVTELQAMMEQGGLRLVDVRTDAEVARGKIPQGDSLPLHLLPLRLSGMDKSSTTVFYCQIWADAPGRLPHLPRRMALPMCITCRVESRHGRRPDCR
jgi:Rhodanese-like domain